jgi:glycosyltransferase involved in cell wall biosynthesis
MNRIAFVVQRYGKEVVGGAEELCRQVAVRLAPDYEIDVLTSCARDYLTWADHYKPGTQKSGGVRIRRFPVSRPRRIRAFGRLSKKIYGRPHSFAQEAEWMDMQGPDLPGLIDYIRTRGDRYDLFVFFTYLYPPTFHGLPLVAEKSILIPCAHDEAPLHLDLFRPLFHQPRGFIFNTEEERLFVQRTFRNRDIPWAVAGAGIDLPGTLPPAPDSEDYLLFLGRVDVEKGCQDLFRLFLRYKKEAPSPLKLFLAGEVNMRLPQSQDIVPLGFVSTAARDTLLANARALVVPSRNESLSLVALEAWAAGAPVLASAASAVLAEHVRRSGGGKLYENYRSFKSQLDGDLSRKAQRKGMGSAGRRYVEKFYSWERIRDIYISFIDSTLCRVKRNRESRD